MEVAADLADVRRIRRVLGHVRRRWMWHTIFRCGRHAAISASAVLGAAAVAFRLATPQTGAALAVFAAVTSFAAIVAALQGLWPLTRRPSDAQVARFIEEHCPQLEDRLVTAVERASAGSLSPPSVLIELLYRDAARRAAEIDLDRTISRHAVARAGAFALASAIVLTGVGVLVAPALRRGADALVGLLAPDRIVTPGGSRVHATAAKAPAVTSIDVRYEYPPSLGMAPRTEVNGGDVYGPAGTRVHVVVHTDTRVREGSLRMTGGRVLPLASEDDRQMVGIFTVTADGSYRVALTGVDGGASSGDTEYFIRVLTDAPPDIRLVEPAADREATPLEEVTIAAHADDDRGVKQFDLVYSVRGGPETVLPFATSGTARSLDGKRVLYLEDLHVRPGDFVTYYARARDTGSGSRVNEARSDLFFVQVTPFEQEFVPPQSSQASAQAAAPENHSLDDLIRAQKDIIVATWRLDRRTRTSGGGSDADVKTVARAQGDLKTRAAERAGPAFARATASERTPGRGSQVPDSGPPSPDSDPMVGAVEAMGRAEQALDAINTSAAVPHETRALAELLRAKASNRRWQMQSAGAGAGGETGNADLTTMFEQQLKREQRTNYETPRGTQKPEEEKRSDALERVRRLAERQADLNRRQEDLARDRDKLSPDEVKRQLERLTREQSELRQQAEQLAQQMRPDAGRPQRGGRGGKGQAGSGTHTDPAASRLADASEAMGQAASSLRSGQVKEATAQSGKATDRLRSAELQMQAGAGGRGSLGDLQMQAREIADAQQRIARDAEAAGKPGNGREAGKTGSAGQSAGGADMRRLAGEKERLADQVERLARGLKDAASSPGLEGRQRQAIDAVGRDLDRLQLPKQMRDGAAAMRAPQKADVNQPPSPEGERELAKTLGRLSDRLGAATAGSADTQRTAEQLGQARETRDRLSQIEQRLRDLRRQAATDAADAAPGRIPSASGRGNRPVGTSGRDPAGARDAELKRLQEEYARELRRAADQLNRLGGDAGSAGLTPEGAQARSPLSARGYNQDFSKWEQLSREIGAGLERAETSLTRKLREQQARDRLQAPSADRVPEQYRRLVERYYESLARKK